MRNYISSKDRAIEKWSPDYGYKCEKKSEEWKRCIRLIRYKDVHKYTYIFLFKGGTAVTASISNLHIN